MSPITANGSTDVRWLRLLADYLIPGNSRTGFLTSYLQDNDQAPKTTEPLLSQQRAHGLPPTLTGDEQILQFWQAITEGTTPQQHVSSNTSPPATRLLQQHISSSNISPPATHILSNTSHLPSCSLFPCASLYCYPQRVALSISGRRSLPVSKCAQRILAVERARATSMFTKTKRISNIRQSWLVTYPRIFSCFERDTTSSLPRRPMNHLWL
jgi:hypothetical protein